MRLQFIVYILNKKRRMDDDPLSDCLSIPDMYMCLLGIFRNFFVFKELYHEMDLLLKTCIVSSRPK
jgi:hypothetical protein